MTNFEIDPTLSSDNHSSKMWSPTVERYWKRIQPLQWQAAVGLLCAALVVGTIFYNGVILNWAANPGNSSNLAITWGFVFDATSIILGLLAGIGLPILLTRGKGYRKTLQIVAFEVAFILVALLISGFILFQGMPSDNSCGQNPISSCTGVQLFPN